MFTTPVMIWGESFSIRERGPKSALRMSECAVILQPPFNVTCDFMTHRATCILRSHTYDRLTMYTYIILVVNTTITRREITYWTRMVVLIVGGGGGPPG